MLATTRTRHFLAHQRPTSFVPGCDPGKISEPTSGRSNDEAACRLKSSNSVLVHRGEVHSQTKNDAGELRHCFNLEAGTCCGHCDATFSWAGMMECKLVNHTRISWALADLGPTPGPRAMMSYKPKTKTTYYLISRVQIHLTQKPLVSTMLGFPFQVGCARRTKSDNLLTGTGISRHSLVQRV